MIRNLFMQVYAGSWHFRGLKVQVLRLEGRRASVVDLLGLICREKENNYSQASFKSHKEGFCRELSVYQAERRAHRME